MKWYWDNGKITLIVIGFLLLLLIVVVATCNGCMESYWEMNNSEK